MPCGSKVTITSGVVMRVSGGVGDVVIAVGSGSCCCCRASGRCFEVLQEEPDEEDTEAFDFGVACDVNR